MRATSIIGSLCAAIMLMACRAGAPGTELNRRPVAQASASVEVVASPFGGAAEPFELVAEPIVEPVVESGAAPVAELASSRPVSSSEPFAGRDRVRVDELIAELDAIADDMARSPAVRADYEALLAAKGLTDDEALYHDFVRVKLAFEATRDGGLWHLRWDITNEKPNSEQIWQQWKRAQPSSDDQPIPTAVAECDELSALFAFVVRKLGVRHVGLFWPQWNHVVAVWTVQSEDGSPVRIVVPTSQIFLDADQSLGTEQFDPWTQKTIFEYRRADVKDAHRIDAQLARFFVVQARRYAQRSQQQLQRLRNARDLAMSGPAS